MTPTIKCDENRQENESVSHIATTKVTCDCPLSFREAAPEVVHHGYQKDELSLEARQLVPPLMPVRHVLGPLLMYYLLLIQ